MKRLAVFCSLLSVAGHRMRYAQSAGDYFVYAGSYTNPTPTTTSASKGIYAWRFDSKTGALTPIGLVAETVNPGACVGTPERQVPVRVELGRRHAGRSRERVCDRSPHRHAHAHQQSERERRSREPGGAGSERQARRDSHLQQRHVLGVRRRARRQAHRGVLHRSARRQTAQREAARAARARHRLFEGQPVRLRRRAWARPRVRRTASIRSSGRRCRPILRSSR